MKKIIIYIIVVMMFLSGCAETSKTIHLGEKAPFTRFALLDGTYRTTENYKGKHLLLLFWTTTCARSRSVIDQVNQWMRNNSNRKYVRVVTVSIDKANKEEKVKEILADLGQNYMENAYSANDIYDEAYMAYDVGEIPTLVLIDPSGKVVGSGNSVDVLDDAFPKRK